VPKLISDVLTGGAFLGFLLLVGWLRSRWLDDPRACLVCGKHHDTRCRR
jgi:hypothetical protein